MTRVAVLILHAPVGSGAGPLVNAFAAIRLGNAERQAAGFRAAGADDVRIDDAPLGPNGLARRLRTAAAGLSGAGLVVLGSGSIPLATAADRRAFVAVAGGPAGRALVNNRYSADIVAIAGATTVLADLTDLASDNGLPRWLTESAGVTVDDRRGTWRLQVDLDSPLDALLVRRTDDGAVGGPSGVVRSATARVAAVAADPRAEVVVAGRASAAGLAWLERSTASRIRALIEERGFRTRAAGQRPIASTLGMLLAREGPAALGGILARLGDAALIDSRVLLAQQFGPHEAARPTAEDRFASDLLLAGRIADPWLRALTEAARDAPIPIVLGGHSLVGPGLRMAFAGEPAMDLRRVPARDQDIASDPKLLAAIRAEIARDGPMPFARFMEIALYDPTRGYYRGAAARPGRAGDFLTAPEAHPLFGRTVARFALAVHAAIGAPSTFTIREHGAGTGALAGPLVEALLAADGAPTSVRYLVAEVESSRLEAVRAAIAEGGRVTVERDDGRPIDGLVIANEVLDALPTHRVLARNGVLREILVGLGPDGELGDVEAAPTTPVLAARTAAESIALEDGQRAEICLAVDDWIELAAAGLRRGVMLLIDYGYPAPDLYDPSRRSAGTSATYLGHQVGADPYGDRPQDLTAHVDLTAVERAAARAGLDLIGSTSQAELLDRLGAGELLVAEQTRPGATLQTYVEARSALVRMIDPGAMGRFRVLAFGRDMEPEIRLAGLMVGVTDPGRLDPDSDDP